jgi:hypothetical protein
VFVYKFDKILKQFVKDGDATTAIASLSTAPTQNSAWSVSMGCDRIRVDYNVFYRASNGTFVDVRNTPNFMPKDVNHDLTIALSTSG